MARRTGRPKCTQVGALGRDEHFSGVKYCGVRVTLLSSAADQAELFVPNLGQPSAFGALRVLGGADQPSRSADFFFFLQLLAKTATTSLNTSVFIRVAF